MKRPPWVNASALHRGRYPLIGAAIIAVIAVLEVTGLAGVPIPGATVLMKALPINLAFGKGEAVAPPVADEPLPDFSLFDVPPATDAFSPNEQASESRAAVSLCPDASPLDFPEEPAGYDAKNVPAAGIYKWREAGKIDVVTPFPFSVSTGPVTFQEIRNVQLLDDGSWTYEYRWLTLLVGIETDTIHVVPNNGIFLTSLHVQPFSPDVSPVDFTPLQPVLLVTLPIAVNAPVGSPIPYVDVQHQRLMTLTGIIDKRQRYDACGTMIEGWVIKNGQRTMQSMNNTLPEDGSTTFDFAIAPHLGGLIVALHRVGSGTLGPIAFRYDTTGNIGTLTPAAARNP